jgi:hypothetical protein
MQYGSLLADLFVRARPGASVARNQHRNLSQKQKSVVLTTVQGVSLTKYDPARHGDFSSCENASFWRIAPYLFVVKNESNRAITALTMRWCWTKGRSDRDHEGRIGTDGFFPHDHTIEPGTELLVGPHSLASLQAARTRAAGFNITGTGVVDLFDESSRLSLSTDAVIYSDGDVLGPDISGTAAKIRRRAGAIAEILERLEAGGSIEELLNERVTQRYAPSDPLPWLLRVLQDLNGRSEALAALLQAARTVPPYRNCG